MKKISCEERRQIELLREKRDLRHIFEGLADEKVCTLDEISSRWGLPISKVKTGLETLVDVDLVSPQVRAVGGSMFYSLSKEGIRLERSGKYKGDCGEYRF